MKTKRENEIASGIFKAGKLLFQPGLNCYPEGGYDVDGRRADCRFEVADSVLFLEIFGGTDLSYMRDRLLIRDSRIFNKQLGKKGVNVLHLICNDIAFNAFENQPKSVVERRLIAFATELEQEPNQHVIVLPKNPTKVQYRSVSATITGLLNIN